MCSRARRHCWKRRRPEEEKDRNNSFVKGEVLLQHGASRPCWKQHRPEDEENWNSSFENNGASSWEKLNLSIWKNELGLGWWIMV